MKKLSPSQPSGQQLFGVQPRSPDRAVWLSESACDALNIAQRIISKQRSDIVLILTRGHEMDSRVKKMSRDFGRKMGALLFKILYRTRSEEADVIFASNGHDDGTGNHIDVAIEVNGQRLILLPNGPFTSADQIEDIKRQYKDILDAVHEALETAGFCVHGNPVEGLQIHCDLQGARGM